MPQIDVLIAELQELRIRETQLIEQIQAAVTEATASSLRSERFVQKEHYLVGDSIYITNAVRRPLRAPLDWTATKERRAVVTRVANNRVHFVTQNGTRTWRQPESLRLVVSDDE